MNRTPRCESGWICDYDVDLCVVAPGEGEPCVSGSVSECDEDGCDYHYDSYCADGFGCQYDFDTGEEVLAELGTDDDERTNLAPSAPELRIELVEQLTDAMIAHSDKSRGAPMAGV